MRDLATDRAQLRLDPFGPPDGAHLRDFEMFGLHGPELEEAVDSPASRLVVARSGVGKSCFLRQLHAGLADREDIAVGEGVQRDAPLVADVRKIEELITEPADRVEAWGAIWRAALLRSFASRLMCSADSSQELDLRLRYPELMREVADCLTPMTVFPQIRSIVASARGRPSLAKYLHHPDWNTLESALAAMLEQTRPASMLIDLVDESMAQVPAAWISCQQGLLRAIGRFRSGPLARWFYVIAATREPHYLALLRVDKSTMLHHEVQVLDLDEDGTANFCRRKLDDLEPEQLFDPGAEGIARLLGRDRVDNEARNCTEDALAYLIRHTRSVARDVVTLGNKLAAARRRTDGGGALDQTVIRRLVRTYAKLFGNEQLAACAHQMAASLSPEDAAREYIVNATSAPSGSLRVQLGEFIQEIGTDRFERDRFERARNEATGRFPVDVMDALWQNGLLGKASDSLPAGHAIYFSIQHSNTEVGRAREYVFHPCLIDALALDHGGAGSPPITPITERP